jgi:hypothetical protein
LVSSVEEGIKLVLLADVEDFLPFIFRWINASGVVGTSVEKNVGACWCGSEVCEHTVNIKTFSFFLEVSVGTGLNTGSLEDGSMVTPCWVADIKGTRSEGSQKLSDDSEGTGSGKSLAGDYSSAGDVGVFPSELGATGTLSEICETIDWRILFVKSLICDDYCLSLADAGENVGLTVVVSVGADTEVALLGVLVSCEANSEAKNGIWGSSGNVLELVVED